MADEFAPRERRTGFEFHATELFSGGKTFPRERFSKEWRWRVLDDLVSIPQKFGLPIAWGSVPRAEVEVGGSCSPNPSWKVSPVVHGQILSFTVASFHVERWMNEAAEQDEIAQMIMENDSNSQKLFRIAQRYLSDPIYYERFGPEYRDFRLLKSYVSAAF
jgi:hypothetical protein